VIIRPDSSQAQDRESSPVKDQRSTTVLRHQLKRKKLKIKNKKKAATSRSAITAHMQTSTRKIGK